MLKVLEKNKKSGVCYAVTTDGVELPVIDITHPAFALTRPNDAEWETMVQRALADQEKFNRLPAWLQAGLMWLLSRQSLLMRGLRGAAGTYLSGMNTYLLKLGPENFGSAYAGKLDKTIAASVPALCIRLRLQAMARMLADGISPVLAARPGQPWHILNIAGGPCADSLNMLILLHQEKPQLLAGRELKIHVLDLESPGPVFAGRALEALQAPGAPLQGVNAGLVHVPYHWSKPQVLREYISDLNLNQSVVAVSSEGGLFDYGTDAEILGNLQVLRELTPRDTVLAGTITQAEGPGRVLNQTSRALTIPRRLEEFSGLAGQAGWRVQENLELPMNRVVGMRKS